MPASLKPYIYKIYKIYNMTTNPWYNSPQFLPRQSMAQSLFLYYPIAIRRCSLMAGRQITEIPLWQKYTLTVEEASLYFRIGQAKLRRLINENEDADFILWNGNRPQIKRKQFEEFIDKLNVI